jgi:hypothetical protein
MIQDTSNVTEQQRPSPIIQTVQNTVTVDSLAMDTMNTETTNEYPPSTIPQLQHVQQVPLKSQIRQMTQDTAEKVPQTDKQGQPMEQGENNPTQSDEEPHQSQTMGSPKKKKKLKTERELTTYRDRMRSRSRHPTPQQS